MGHFFDSGFVVREPAWHGLANVVPDFITDFDEARRAAGMTWDVVEQPVYIRDEWGFRILEDSKALLRDDTDAVLSVQSSTYETFTIRQMGPLVEALVGEDGVQYETMVSLKGGRKIAFTMRLRDPIEIPGDPKGLTLPRGVLQNSFDGSGALRWQAVMTRVVCDNTARMADVQAKKSGTEFVFRHTKNIHDYVDQAKAAVKGLKDSRQDYLDWANDLLGIRVTPEEEAEFIRIFFPEPAGQVVSDRVRANIWEARQEFRNILQSATMTDDVAGTGYGLVQASIEYLDHVRGARSKETTFSRSYLNREPLKVKAEKIVRAVTGSPR